MARTVERIFKKEGINVVTGARVENVEAGSDSVKFSYGDEKAEVDYLVIAGGRGADVDALGLDDAGLKLDDDGKIDVDGGQKTSKDGIYAIGDITPGPALAHKAQEEGIVAAETIAGSRHDADRPRRDPRGDLHPSAGRQRRPDRGGGQGGRPRRQDVEVQARRRRSRRRLRRSRRHGQARRRQAVRRDPRRPHRRQPGLRHDRRAGRGQGARGRLPGAGRGSSIPTRRSPRRSPRPPARSTNGPSTPDGLPGRRGGGPTHGTGPQGEARGGGRASATPYSASRPEEPDAQRRIPPESFRPKA